MTGLKKVSLSLIMNYKLDNIGVLNLAFQKYYFFLTLKKFENFKLPFVKDNLTKSFYPVSYP